MTLSHRVPQCYRVSETIGAMRGLLLMNCPVGHARRCSPTAAALKLATDWHCCPVPVLLTGLRAQGAEKIGGLRVHKSQSLVRVPSVACYGAGAIFQGVVTLNQRKAVVAELRVGRVYVHAPTCTTHRSVKRAHKRFVGHGQSLALISG